MRHLLYAARVVLELSGILLTATSWLIRARSAAVANALLVAGTALIAAGLWLRYWTKLKRCPRCAGKVNVDLARCNGCGFEFSRGFREAMFRPFYK
jgi:hypothetical protein